MSELMARSHAQRLVETAQPSTLAHALCAAPTLEQKTALLRTMERRQRREALELVPAALVGALVQNLEEENRYLLGDLSLEQFRSLLSLCGSERKFYWISTALSFTNARANVLPLLLSTRELVDILRTRPEFEEHLRSLGDYPLEDSRLPPEALTDPAQALVDLFGAEGLLRQFPVADRELDAVLRTILAYDPDRYVDLVRKGLHDADYAGNHPLEWDALTADPVLLDRLERIEPLRTEPLPDEAPEPEAGPPLALIPVAAPSLARLAAALPPAERVRVASELQHLYLRQAVAEGGSFLREDLQRVAASVEAYLLLGLQAESGGRPEREAEVLAERPLHQVSRSGARVVESLRQVALRLAPLRKVMSPEQRALVGSLASPQFTLGADGAPCIRLHPTGTLDLSTAAALLQEAAAWTELARSVGLARTEQRLAGSSVDLFLEELALAAVLFGRLEAGLVEPSDRARFTRRYVARGSRALHPEARAGLRRAVGDQPVISLLERALERVAQAD